jgi:hypothetical protein
MLIRPDRRLMLRSLTFASLLVSAGCLWMGIQFLTGAAPRDDRSMFIFWTVGLFLLAANLYNLRVTRNYTRWTDLLKRTKAITVSIIMTDVVFVALATLYLCAVVWIIIACWGQPDCL